MTWFYGPIDLKPPPPPLPTEKYEKEIKSEINRHESFEEKARFYSYEKTYPRERYNREKNEAEKGLAKAKEKLKKILQLRGKST